MDQQRQLHEGPPPQRDAPSYTSQHQSRGPYRRKRPALSCFECRRKKVKCDRDLPCRNCALGRVDCAYEGGGRPERPSWAGPPPTSMDAFLDQARHISGEVEHGSHDAWAHHTPAKAPSAAYHTQVSNGMQHASGGVDLRHQMQRVESSQPSKPANPEPVPGSDESGWHILKQQVGVKDSEVPLNKHRPPRWSEWMGTAPDFSIIYACYSAATSGVSTTWFKDAEVAPLLPKIREGLEKAKTIAVRIKASRPSRSIWHSASDLVPPSRAFADTMVDLYFKTFESVYRILHRPTFLADYEKYWTSPENAPSNLRLKVLLAIAIGASIHETADVDTQFRNTVHQWIAAAQEWLTSPSEKARLDIAGIQVHCLAFLARQIYTSKADLVWASMGSMINAAVQLGLHRDPKYLPGISVLDAEIRRRLWATIVEMEMQTSLDTAMAMRISQDDFDTEAPSHVDDDKLDEKTTELHSQPRTTYTATSMQLLLHDTVTIRIKILKLLNGLHSRFLYADALALSKELTDAHRTFGKFAQENLKSGLTAFHRNLFDFFVCRFLLPLHCPFASKARTIPLFHYSRKVSLDAAMAIVSTEPDEQYSRLMIMNGNILREGIRCAITAINLEIVTQADADRLDGTLHRSSPFTEVLRTVLKNMMKLSEEQIKRGDTNVKLHALICSVLAITDAKGSEASLKVKVAQAAIDSLELCLELLQTVSDTVSTPSTGETDMLSNLELDLGLGPWDWNTGLTDMMLQQVSNA